MANEPERPIEKLLRAAAKKRRDEAGAPFELHSADRRLLQGEVARKFAQPHRETRSFADILGQLWPRFAWGIALLAVLGVAAWLLLPVPGNDHPAAFLAKNEPGSEAMPAKEPMPPTPAAPATVASPPATAAKTMPAEVAYADTASPARATPARQLGATPQPLAEGSSAAMSTREAGEKLTLAAAPQLADRQEQARRQLAAPGGTRAQAPAGAVNGALDSRYGLAGKPAPPANLPAAPAVPPAVPMAAPAANVAAADESAKLPSDKLDVPAAQYKSLVAAASANRLSQSSVATDGLSKDVPEALKKTIGNAIGQRFVQVVPGAKAKSGLAGKATAASPVLASFQVEQTGQTLRIVDGDGSVYTGYWQLAEAARRARSFKAEAPAAAQAYRAPGEVLEAKASPSLDAAQLAPQTYFFRVAGTNRSVNQKVVFTGNLLTATNLTVSLPVATNLAVGSSLGGIQGGSAQSGGLLLLNSRISGKVVIGSGKAVEINALPTSP
jgi:hypothetical protein